MTYQNDPNINRRTTRRDINDTSYTGWIIGGLVAVAVVIGLFTIFGRDKTNDGTASNTNRPAATAPTTTGSGAGSSVIPNNPNGAATQRDANQPTQAPATTPAR